MIAIMASENWGMVRSSSPRSSSLIWNSRDMAAIFFEFKKNSKSKTAIPARRRLGYHRGMSDERDKPNGPIGWLADAYRADPVRIKFWAASILVITILIRLLMESDWMK